MSLRSRMLTWWRAVRREADMHAQIDEELRFHVESYAADLMRDGTTRAEAMRRAAAELGSLAANKWIGDGWLPASSNGLQSTLVTFDKAVYRQARKQGYSVVMPG